MCVVNRNGIDVFCFLSLLSVSSRIMAISNCISLKIIAPDGRGVYMTYKKAESVFEAQLGASI